MPTDSKREEELKKVEGADESKVWPVLIRPKSPLYASMLRECVAKEQPYLAHLVIDILAEHFAHRGKVSLRLSPEHQNTLKVLAEHWQIPKEQVLNRMLDHFSDPDFLTALIEYETKRSERKQQVLKEAAKRVG